MVIPSLTGALRRVNPSADLDEETLTRISDLTGGRYFRARDTASLQQIYRLLDEMEPVAEPEGGFRPVRVLYYWPLGGALVLAFLVAAASLLSSLTLPRLYKAKVHAD
jgi:Ca-activated chloride channel family protein